MIQEVDEIIENLQVSKNMEQKINQVVIYLSPFLIILIEHLLEKSNSEVYILYAVSGVMFLYGFYLILKGPIKELLDSQYNKMKELKRYLQDTKIQMLEKE